MAAGDCFQRCRELRGGETIAWSFSVVAGDGDGWFGASDIEFSAVLWLHPEFAQDGQPDEPQEEDVVEALMVQASEGEISGKYTALRDSVITLRWSNEHSRMRSKGLRYRIDL